MFKKASKVFVLTIMIAVLVPSYAVMGMENEVKQTKVFVPKEMASEEELLEEDFIEDQQSDTKTHAILIMFSKPTKFQRCNWLGTVIPVVVGIVGPHGLIISAGLTISAGPFCDYMYGS